MEGLPECASESFQQKSARFGKDVFAIGDELRALLREIRKSYRHRPAPMETEHAAEDWFAFGCDEWFEPVSSVAPSLLDNLGEWASRFQRAARVVDVGQAIEGFSSLLDMPLLITLSGCLTPNWDRRTGAHLMEVFYKLAEHSKALTQAADAWTYQQLPNRSKPAEEWNTHQGVAAESEPRELTQNESIVREVGAPSNRPTVPTCAAEYLKNPALAAYDIGDILGGFDQDWGATPVEADGDAILWRFARNGQSFLTQLVVSDNLKFIARCVALASRRKPDLFGRLASALSETCWGANLEAFLTSSNPKWDETFYLDHHPFGELMESLYDFSDMLEFERLTKPDIEAPTAASGSESLLSKAPSVSVNALMLDVMQSVGNEVCLEWSVEDWRDKLFERFRRKPSKSTIHKQPTWDLIRTLRVQAGTEAHEHQTAKDETGRRRSRAT